MGIFSYHNGTLIAPLIRGGAGGEVPANGLTLLIVIVIVAIGGGNVAGGVDVAAIFV